MTPTREGFPKVARIRRRREFLALGRVGERNQSAHFIVLTRPHDGESRLGVTVSRKVGGAVVRNRIKRRVREVFRRDPERLMPRHDLVVIARAGAGVVPLDDVRRELRAASKPRRARPARPRT
jgi:ribonuclease P protein component